MKSCVSEGDSLDESVANIEKAIQLYLEPDSIPDNKNLIIRELVVRVKRRSHSKFLIAYRLEKRKEYPVSRVPPTVPQNQIPRSRNKHRKHPSVLMLKLAFIFNMLPKP